MKVTIMTLNDLVQALAAVDPKVPLVFDAPSGRTAPGYHVTEVRLATLEAVDCGGVRSNWREAILQILDGQGRGYMPVGKFLDIAERSVAAIDGLDQYEIRVEFASGNDRLELLSLQAPRIDDARIVVPLSPVQAACKPLVRAAEASNKISCCGTAAVVSCC